MHCFILTFRSIEQRVFELVLEALGFYMFSVAIQDSLNQHNHFSFNVVNILFLDVCWLSFFAEYIQFLLFSNRKDLCLQCPSLTLNYKQTHLSPLNCVLIRFWFEKWEIIPIFGINRRECLWGWVIFCHAAWETVLAMKKNFLRPSIVEHRLQGNAGTEDGIKEQRAERWGCFQHDGNIPS